MSGHVRQDLLLFAMRELKTFQGLGDLNIFIQTLTIINRLYYY